MYDKWFVKSIFIEISNKKETCYCFKMLNKSLFSLYFPYTLHSLFVGRGDLLIH